VLVEVDDDGEGLDKGLARGPTRLQPLDALVCFETLER
jgi:hypothetical protein